LKVVSAAGNQETNDTGTRPFLDKSAGNDKKMAEDVGLQPYFVYGHQEGTAVVHGAGVHAREDDRVVKPPRFDRMQENLLTARDNTAEAGIDASKPKQPAQQDRIENSFPFNRTPANVHDQLIDWDDKGKKTQPDFHPTTHVIDLHSKLAAEGTGTQKEYQLSHDKGAEAIHPLPINARNFAEVSGNSSSCPGYD
jgi:hypothetical protein